MTAMAVRVRNGARSLSVALCLGSVAVAHLGCTAWSQLYAVGAPSQAANGTSYGFIDESGKLVVPLSFTEVSAFSEGWATVRTNGEVLLVDGSGKTRAVAQPKHLMRVGLFHDGLCDVSIGFATEVGYLNTSGRLAIPAVFERGWAFQEGLAAVRQRGKWGFIDTGGRFQVTPAYEMVTPFRNGLAAGLKNNAWHIIDSRGLTLFSCPFAPVPPRIGDTLIAAMDGRRHGAFTRAGAPAIPCRFGFLGPDSSGLLRAMNDGKWGFVDRAGETIIPFQYDWCDDMDSGLAVVERNGVYEYVDTAGAVAVPLRFSEEPSRFVDALAHVPAGGRPVGFTYFNKAGVIVWRSRIEGEPAPILP